MSGLRDQSVTLAMTGASGAQYGLRLLECLLRCGRSVFLIVSRPAQIVIDQETELELPSRPADMQRYLMDRYGRDASGTLHVLGREQWTSCVASGSGAPRAMVVCPCTAATLGALAAGAGRDLIERAADVALKERGRLILVVRETPHSVLHLENMLRLARAGALILPANPGFYHRPRRVEQLVDFVVARVLDHLDVSHGLLEPWGREDMEEGGDAG